MVVDHHINVPVAITAENLAEKYSITRQQCDEFAVLSNRRWKAGLFRRSFRNRLRFRIALLCYYFLHCITLFLYITLYFFIGVLIILISS